LSFARPALVACLLAAVVPATRADEAKAPAATPPPKAAPATAPPAKWARPAAAPDDELLEFLGSVDSEEGDEAWLDYLSQADIGKAARKQKAAAADPEGEKK
jgi:hypothetical protein